MYDYTGFGWSLRLSHLAERIGSAPWKDRWSDTSVGSRFKRENKGEQSCLKSNVLFI